MTLQLNKSMRILHVIPSVAPSRGGSSKAALDMVRALRHLNIDAEIACTNDDGPQLLDVKLGSLVEYCGVPVRFFARFSPPFSAVREFAYSAEFKRWLHQHIEDYDVLHVHALFTYGSTFAMRLARKRGVAYVAHPIGHLESWSLAQGRLKKSVYLNLFEKSNLRSANRVHFTAESESRQALSVVPELRPAVIPLGLDLPALRDNAKSLVCSKWKIPADIPVIVFLARLHPKKGLELLFEALAALENQPFRLLIAGDGEAHYRRELQLMIEKLNLQDHCQFIGYVDGQDKDVLLQGADLFALTSYSENFGIAVLEALASGTAVLISQGVALSQSVGNHQLGFVTPQSVQAIQSALKVALAAPEMTADMGLKARIYVEQSHQWPAVAAQLAATYREIMAETGMTNH